MIIDLGKAIITEVKAGTTCFRKGKITVETMTLFIKFTNLPDKNYISLTRKDAKLICKQLDKLLVIKESN